MENIILTTDYNGYQVQVIRDKSGDFDAEISIAEKGVIDYLEGYINAADVLLAVERLIDTY